MRNVSYFSAGLVADFAISDQAFEKFLVDLDDAEGEIEPYGEDDLMTARTILDTFMARAREDEDAAQGPGEVLAASYIWNYFNTNPQAESVIEGDIVIVDPDGTLTMVEYASARDVNISQN
ncbi:hypothetical protein ACFL12_04920 [Pseudomonadota bacterium]